MKLKRRILKIVASVVILCSVLYALTVLCRINNLSEEGALMNAACLDMEKDETLRAEFDFDKIVETIASQEHSYRDHSDTVLNHAILDLKHLREEALFHTQDLGLYHQHFANVLNKLTYLELEDAIYMTENNDFVKAKRAIHRAQSYIHDALTFPENPNFKKQMELSQEIEKLKGVRLKKKEILHSLEELRKRI